ncbi:MAG: GIY-YIG nuclease family protein [Candidatus Brocadiaceae bacterium]|nr:GIY-YIG nuclease family protein [Candidatus Brocadiaceae bacterium]
MLYTGITTDVKRRFEEHKEGSGNKGSKYLRGKKPLTLALQKKIGNKSLALQIENKVKKLPKIKKELLIDGKTGKNEIKKLIAETIKNRKFH